MSSCFSCQCVLSNGTTQPYIIILQLNWSPKLPLLTNRNVSECESEISADHRTKTSNARCSNQLITIWRRRPPQITCIHMHAQRSMSPICCAEIERDECWAVHAVKLFPGMRRIVGLITAQKQFSRNFHPGQIWPYEIGGSLSCSNSQGFCLREWLQMT